MSASDRRAKLDRAHPEPSIRRQCAMLGLACSGVYRKPRPANDNGLEAMRRIDALYTERPFFGARRIARTLTACGRWESFFVPNVPRNAPAQPSASRPVPDTPANVTFFAELWHADAPSTRNSMSSA